MASLPENRAPEDEPQSLPQFTLGPMALSDEPGREMPVGDSAQGDGRSVSASDSHGDSPHTANENISMLRMLVQNEQFSPEILPSQSQSIDALRNLVDAQTDLVDTEEDDEAVDQLSFESQLKRMELERINYQLRHYLRLRIKKIQTFIMHIFKGDGPYDRLSSAEQRFAVGYSDLVEEHFNKAFLNLLPQRLQVMEKDGTVEPVTLPNLNGFVFCRVRNDLGSYVIGEDASDDSLDLSKGDILCIRYKSIRELIQSEDVELL